MHATQNFWKQTQKHWNIIILNINIYIYVTVLSYQITWRLHLKSQPGHNGSMGMTAWISPRSVFICWTAMRSTVSLSSLRDMALQVGTNEASSSIKLFILSLRLFSIWLWASLLTTKSPIQCYNWKKWHMIYNRLYPLINKKNIEMLWNTAPRILNLVINPVERKIMSLTSEKWINYVNTSYRYTILFFKMVNYWHPW